MKKLPIISIKPIKIQIKKDKEKWTKRNLIWYNVDSDWNKTEERKGEETHLWVTDDTKYWIGIYDPEVMSGTKRPNNKQWFVSSNIRPGYQEVYVNTEEQAIQQAEKWINETS